MANAPRLQFLGRPRAGCKDPNSWRNRDRHRTQGCDGHLGGAALDAHYQYPLPPAHPLWAFPQVILTPHISGTTFSPHFQAGLRQIFFENARLFAENSPLINLVQPSDLA